MEITNKLINERQQYLLNKQYRWTTVSSYTSNLKTFLNFLKLENKGTTVTENEIRLTDVERWKTYLSQLSVPVTSIYYTKRTSLSPSTIQGKILWIKSFLKFLNFFYDRGIDYRKIETKKCQSDYVESITQTEFELFMNFVGKYEKYRINALRSQLLINIGYTSGLRLSEMLNLKVQEIKNGETRITGKGNKTRWVFFTPSSERLLTEYLDEREKPIPRTWKVENKSDFVFISHNSGYDFWNPIKKNTVCERIKKYSDEINIGKRITVHSLRHSYATRLLESWMNIREIQELLWHKDIQTTENYCHVLKSNLWRKVSQIFS